MGTKRKLSEIESVHPSRQAQVPGANPKPRKKPRNFGPQLSKKPESQTSINAIKKRIRNVMRRLERSDNLSADVRVECERALAAYQQDLATAEGEKKRRKMISRYHMVRFFGMERQKASRHVKKLRKRLLEAKSQEDVEDVKVLLHIAEVDLNYTQFYPLNMRYVSLYPQSSNNAPAIDNGNAETGAPKTKPPMWAEVEKCMSEGTLNLLRDGQKIKVPEKQKPHTTQPQRSKSTSLPSPSPSRHRPNSTTNKHPATSPETSHRQSSRSASQRKARTDVEPASPDPADYDDADDESDGGFFEE